MSPVSLTQQHRCNVDMFVEVCHSEKDQRTSSIRRSDPLTLHQTLHCSLSKTMAPPNLAQLPAEIKLLIISELVVKDIVKLRSVCRIFDATIDNSENHAVLLRPMEENAICQLKNIVSRLIEYDHQETSFLEALQNFIHVRGMRVECSSSTWARRHYEAFATNWLRLKGSSRNLLGNQHPVVAHMLDHEQITSLAWCLVKTHVTYHLQHTRCILARAGRNNVDAAVWDVATFIDRLHRYDGGLIW